jgi:hypothetical protein
VLAENCNDRVLLLSWRVIHCSSPYFLHSEFT